MHFALKYGKDTKQYRTIYKTNTAQTTNTDDSRARTYYLLGVPLMLYGVVYMVRPFSAQAKSLFVRRARV